MYNEVRKLLDAAPFVPFMIHLHDGREFRVRHPDFVLVSRAGTLHLDPGDHSGIDILPLRAISGLKLERALPEDASLEA